MKKVGKPVFFIIVLLIAAMGYLTVAGVTTVYGDSTTRAIKGIDDVRWGIDIRGGVDVTFSPPEGVTATAEEMDAAESIIQVRLVSQNITDSEVYTDHDKNRIIVRFPWKADETEFNPEQAIAELGAMANLTFREGANIGPDGKPAGDTLNKPVLEGKDIESATAVYSTANSAGHPRIWGGAEAQGIRQAEVCRGHWASDRSADLDLDGRDADFGSHRQKSDQRRHRPDYRPVHLAGGDRSRQ